MLRAAAGPVSALLLRMASQWSQLTALAAGVVQPQPDRDSDVMHLTRDSFNTHKMLVVVTACGKVGRPRRHMATGETEGGVHMVAPGGRVT